MSRPLTTPTPAFTGAHKAAIGVAGTCLITASFVGGALIGGSVSPDEPTPETRIVQVTPAACLDALDAADAELDLAARGFASVYALLSSLEVGDLDGMETAAADIETAALEVGESGYVELRAACLSAEQEG